MSHSKDVTKNSSKNILLSSARMSIATFLSRILGLVREQVIAAYFGASGLTDAFHVAFRIPNLLRDLLAEGAFSASFVPSFVNSLKKGKDEAAKLLWSSSIIMFFITFIVGILICVFSDQIVHLFAPRFASDLHKFAVTSNLTKIMAFYLLFVSLAALLMGVLNSLKIFFMPALAPAIFNIVSISVILIFANLQNIEPIYSLGIGVLLGGICQFIFQLPIVFKNGLQITLPKNIFNPETINIFKKLGPGLIGFAATQINLLVTTILATSAGVGAVSWLQYAFRLFQLPVGIASVSIGNSTSVHFSEAWKSQKVEEAKEVLNASYNLSAFILAPALIGLLVYSEEIISLIFQRGKFTELDTMRTSLALRFYAVGLPLYGIYKVFVPAFYAMDKQRIPVYASIVSIVLNILFCTLAAPYYGFAMMALGTSISMLVNVMLQAYFLKNYLKLASTFFINKKFSKIFISSFLTAVICYFFKLQIQFSEFSLVMKLIILGILLSSVVVIYTGLLFIMGEKSFTLQLVKKIKNKF